MTMNQVVAAVVPGAVASVTIVEREGLLVRLHRPTSKYRISRKKRKKERKKAREQPPLCSPPPKKLRRLFAR